MRMLRPREVKQLLPKSQSISTLKLKSYSHFATSYWPLLMVFSLPPGSATHRKWDALMPLSLGFDRCPKQLHGRNSWATVECDLCCLVLVGEVSNSAPTSLSQRQFTPVTHPHSTGNQWPIELSSSFASHHS